MENEKRGEWKKSPHFGGRNDDVAQLAWQNGVRKINRTPISCGEIAPTRCLLW